MRADMTPGNRHDTKSSEGKICREMLRVLGCVAMLTHDESCAARPSALNGPRVIRRKVHSATIRFVQIQSVALTHATRQFNASALTSKVWNVTGEKRKHPGANSRRNRGNPWVESERFTSI